MGLESPVSVGRTWNWGLRAKAGSSFGLQCSQSFWAVIPQTTSFKDQHHSEELQLRKNRYCCSQGNPVACIKSGNQPKLNCHGARRFRFNDRHVRSFRCLTLTFVVEPVIWVEQICRRKYQNGIPWSLQTDDFCRTCFPDARTKIFYLGTHSKTWAIVVVLYL